MAGDKGEGPGVQAKQKSLRSAILHVGHNGFDPDCQTLSLKHPVEFCSSIETARACRPSARERGAAVEHKANSRLSA
jgi:hypothetical protein